MSARSLNKVTLIGNLTRDPELRYTPAGTGVCTIGLATNRSWTTQTGETKEETEFHRVVAWNKLAELCAQLLTKGRKVYVEGRLSTHSWTGQDGNQRTTTEIVIEDMILLDSKRSVKEDTGTYPAQTPVVSPDQTAQAQKADSSVPADQPSGQPDPSVTDKAGRKKAQAETEKEQPKEEAKSEDITPEDIPF